MTSSQNIRHHEAIFLFPLLAINSFIVTASTFDVVCTGHLPPLLYHFPTSSLISSRPPWQTLPTSLTNASCILIWRWCVKIHTGQPLHCQPMQLNLFSPQSVMCAEHSPHHCSSPHSFSISPKCSSHSHVTWAPVAQHPLPLLSNLTCTKPNIL